MDKGVGSVEVGDEEVPADQRHLQPHVLILYSEEEEKEARPAQAPLMLVSHKSERSEEDQCLNMPSQKSVPK